MEAGMAGLELQKSGSGSGEGLGGDGDALLPGKKAAVISLSAKAGGDVPADIAAYHPPLVKLAAAEGSGPESNQWHAHRQSLVTRPLCQTPEESSCVDEPLRKDEERLNRVTE